MGDLSETERKHITEVLKGLANETRVHLLLALAKGKSRSEIAADLDMSRGGIHRNLERLREAELVYRPDDTEYELTPLGVHWVELLQGEAEILSAIFDALDEAEGPVRDEVEATKQSIEEKENEGFSFQIDDATWERTIHTEKWKQAMDTINELLRVTENSQDDD